MIKTDGKTDGLVATSTVASGSKGLQNLYSSVRSRPAPPNSHTENTVDSDGRRPLSGRCFDAATTEKNGEASAKRGAPSVFRPSVVDFRPSLHWQSGPSLPSEEPASVYLAVAWDRVKVGIARRVSDRLNDIQLAAGEPIHLAWAAEYRSAGTARAVEALAQYLLWKDRKIGEWFAVDPACAARTLNRAHCLVLRNSVVRERFPRLLSSLASRGALAIAVVKFRRHLRAQEIKQHARRNPLSELGKLAFNNRAYSADLIEVRRISKRLAGGSQ